MPPRVKEIDRGWKKITRRFLKPGHTAARVGVQGTKAEEKYAEGPSNVLVAGVHEFGAGHNPERSFLRSTFDKELKKYKKEMGNIGRRMADGTETAEQGLTMLGETYRGDVVGRIQRGEITPPLKPATVAAKGGETTPLLETGQLINAITVELEK